MPTFGSLIEAGFAFAFGQALAGLVGMAILLLGLLVVIAIQKIRADREYRKLARRRSNQ